MLNQHLKPKQLASAGILMALQLILTRIFVIETPFLRISFLFIPTFIMSILFGPVLTGLLSALSDTLGLFLFGKISLFFPGFTLSSFLTGFIFGLFFYKRNLNLKTIIFAVLVNTIIVDVCLNTLWLYIMLGNIAIAQIPVRLLKAVVFVPIQIVVLYTLAHQKVLKKQLIKFES